MQVELTEQQLNNMAIFLNKVSVQGIEEASALMDLAQAINKPLSSINNQNGDSERGVKAKTPKKKIR